MLSAACLLAGSLAGAAGEVRFTEAPAAPGFTFLSWDTEGDTQSKLNLLRPAAAGTFQVLEDGTWIDGAPFVLEAADGMVRLGIDGKAELVWKVEAGGGGMTWSLRSTGPGGTIGGIRIGLPFNPRMAATAILPARWLPPDGFTLPAVLSAADFGQLLVRHDGAQPVTGRFTGDRRGSRIDVAFEIPAPAAGATMTLSFTPWHIPTPAGVDEATWRKVRRGWWNVYGPCVRGNLGIGIVPAPAGILCNNPISDPVSSLYALIADHALLIPDLAPGVSAEYLLRYSVEWWLDHQTDPSGAVEAYENHRDMLDAPASIIVAAWACAEMAGDPAWAISRLPQLEKVADFLASRDVDQDGIVESPHSGNADTLTDIQARGATACDTINSGHKDIYINALAYRAFRCMADLEARADHRDRADRYAGLADRLRAAFMPTFRSPDTKLLSWWISADGARHDYWAPGILGLPIAYGLVPEQEAAALLDRMHAKTKDVGFDRLDIGLPIVLTPIRRSDYHRGVGARYGSPTREDGSDTFQRYLNGGCLVNDQVHWFAAHHRLGLAERVRPQLDAMIGRQSTPVFANGGSFQNGIVNEPPKGAEFFTWNGEPCGYEGHLVYSWLFLDAALTRDPQHMRRIFRPLLQPPTEGSR